MQVSKCQTQTDTDTITLTEHPDVDKVHWVVGHPDVHDEDRRGLRDYARAAQSGEVQVTYTRRGPGRPYPETTVRNAMTGLDDSIGKVSTYQWRRVRATLFADSHIDVDIVNCHPRLLLALVKGCDAIQPECYAHLTEYVRDRDAIFGREGLEKELAKKLVCTTLYGGGVARFRKDTGFAGELPPWWAAFVSEIKQMSKLVWRQAVAKEERKAITAYLNSDAYKEAHPN